MADDERKIAVGKILTVLNSRMAAMCRPQVDAAIAASVEHGITVRELIEAKVEFCWKT